MPAAARPEALIASAIPAAPVELFGHDHLHLATLVGGRALDPLEPTEPLPPRLP
jgi:hypothetical protein